MRTFSDRISYTSGYLECRSGIPDWLEEDGCGVAWVLCRNKQTAGASASKGGKGGGEGRPKRSKKQSKSKKIPPPGIEPGPPR